MDRAVQAAPDRSSQISRPLGRQSFGGLAFSPDEGGKTHEAVAHSNPLEWEIMVVLSLIGMGLAVGLMVGLSLSPVVNGLISALVALCCAIVAAATGLEAALARRGDEPREPHGAPEQSRDFGEHAPGGGDDAGDGGGAQSSVKSGPFSQSQLHGDPQPKMNLGRRRPRPLNPLPMCIFTIGVAAGALAGTKVRTSNWLGPDLESILHKWSDGSAGLDKKMVAERVFDLEYPKSITAEKGHDVKSEPEKESKESSSKVNVPTQRVSGGLFTTEISLKKSECDRLLTVNGLATLRNEALSLPDGSVKRMILNFKNGEDISRLVKEVCSQTSNR